MARNDTEPSRARLQACDLRCWELAGGLEPLPAVTRRRASSTGCCRVVSLQVTSGGSSGQCAPVRPSNAWWNDKWNDVLDLRWWCPTARLLRGGRRMVDDRGAVLGE